MEPVSVTLGVVVAAWAADKAAERAVEGGEGVLVRLVGWLRQRFSGDERHQAETAFVHVEQVPDSPSRLQALAR